jgi:hypothetical protein
MQLNFNHLFPELSGNSSVWIYSSNRILTADECSEINALLKEFVQSWATHGSSLTAQAKVLYDRFVTISVDESNLAASGCSIDSSVRLIKEIGHKFNIDFFDRLNVYITNLQQIERVSFHQLDEYGGWFYFDPLIKNLEELRSNWPLKLS